MIAAGQPVDLGDQEQSSHLIGGQEQPQVSETAGQLLLSL